MGDADVEDVAEELKERALKAGTVSEDAVEPQSDPLTTVKKALAVASFDGLVVLD